MTAEKEFISLQVQALPHTTLSYIQPLPTSFQTSTLTFLKSYVLQVSLCTVQVLQCMPRFCPSFPCSGVTNIPVCIQPCSGTLSEGMPCSAARMEELCLPGDSLPQLLAEGLGASRGASDGWWPCKPPPPLGAAQREQLQGTVQSI